MKINTSKVAMIGCGFVGSASCFALMQSGLFREMVLIDANQAKAEGEALDISHGLLYAKPMDIYAGDYSDIADAAIVVVSAAQKLTGFPESRVIGSGTVLDTARLKYLLGEHLGVDSRTIHAFIVGEHGDSEIVAWSSANVSGVPLSDFCELRGHFKHRESMQEIADSVKNSAYEIIEKKQATYYGIAMAVKRICEAIIRDEETILPVSVTLHGDFGIEGATLSIPAVVGKDGIETIVPIKLSVDELVKLQESAATLKKIYKEAMSDDIRDENMAYKEDE